MSSIIDRDDYVTRVLGTYRATPGTTGHARAADRELAITLHERGIAVELVEAALRLGALRRVYRDPASTPLPLVRALHYFMPVLDELLADPPHPAYLNYLHERSALKAPPAPRTTQPHASGVDDAGTSPSTPCPADPDR
ncbi:MAG: hypothetical protein KA072_15240 [Thermoanaerobaculaceae bacterium]|nr:hypothetical protein [Thermoanaerobaculaceae bacterium]